jgi:hypothetical protein
MGKVVEHPRAGIGRQRRDRAAREAEEKAVRRRRRDYLKKTKPERDRLSVASLCRMIEQRTGYVIWIAAREMAERKCPLPGPDQDTAFTDAYRNVANAAVRACENAAAQAAGFNNWNEFQKAHGLADED